LDSALNRRTFGIAAASLLAAGCAHPATTLIPPEASKALKPLRISENRCGGRFAHSADVTMVEWSAHRYAFYGVDTSGDLIEVAYVLGSERVTNLGHPAVGLAGPVAAVSWIDSQYGVFAMAKDGRLWGRIWLVNRWVHWENWGDLPEPMTSICAVSWAHWRYGVYGIGTSGQLYEKYWIPFNPGGSSWSSLGQPDGVRLASSVTAVSWFPGNYTIYALDANGKIWEKNWGLTHWTNWRHMKGPHDSALQQISVNGLYLASLEPTLFAYDGTRVWLSRPEAHWENVSSSLDLTNSRIVASSDITFDCYAFPAAGDHFYGRERLQLGHSTWRTIKCP
jgi:hypothetical protein